MKQRIITAIIALALFIPIVVYGGVPLMIATYVIASVGIYELLRMRKIKLISVPGVVSIILLWFFLLPTKYQGFLAGLGFSKTEFALMAALLLLTYTVVVKNKFTFDDVAFSLFSVLYIGLGFFYLMETRELGLTFIFYCLFIVFATDTGAYFIGRAFGKNKLWPDISPNKTVEGALGGIASALGIALLFFIFADIHLSLFKQIFITILLSSFGQMGDLVESALKRHYDVKDSGNILPGHGGVLDRFDSLLFVLPLLNFLL